MTDEPTCGKGLAEHAGLPATMSRLAAAMAGVFEHHLASVERGRAEEEAYTKVSGDWRTVAGKLQTLADRMRSYRDLPMEAHDEAVLMSPDAVESFATFVASQRALLDLLRSSVERNETMLAQMR